MCVYYKILIEFYKMIIINTLTPRYKRLLKYFNIGICFPVAFCYVQTILRFYTVHG